MSRMNELSLSISYRQKALILKGITKLSDYAAVFVPARENAIGYDHDTFELNPIEVDEQMRLAKELYIKNKSDFFAYREYCKH